MRVLGGEPVLSGIGAESRVQSDRRCRSIAADAAYGLKPIGRYTQPSVNRAKTPHLRHEVLANSPSERWERFICGFDTEGAPRAMRRCDRAATPGGPAVSAGT